MSLVGGWSTRVSVTVTLAAAGNYAANDVVSDDADAGEGNDIVFSNMARQEARGGYVVKGQLTCSVDTVTFRGRLWLFHTDPTGSEKDDNAAFNLVAADRLKTVGYLDFPALSDQGAVSYALANLDVPLHFVCATGDRSLYGILQTLDAETNEAAGMTITIDLDVVQE